MTSVSLIAPYAPQPATTTGAHAMAGTPALTPAISSTASNPRSGHTSDHSGHGTGNSTGTGSAITRSLLDRARHLYGPNKATSESVVEAQAKAGETAHFLAQQQAEKNRNRAAAAALDTAQKAIMEARIRAEAEAQIKAENFKMPDPLPTAPILQVGSR